LGIKLGLRPLVTSQGSYIYSRWRHSLILIRNKETIRTETIVFLSIARRARNNKGGNNSKPIRGELKYKRDIRDRHVLGL
jgi:hypothetical protein